jgi:hypothetical protein
MRFLSLLLACLIALPAWAAEVSVHLDTREIRVGQTVGLRVVVLDAREVRPPDFPKANGLQVTFQGTQQSTVRINFRTTRTKTFSYSVTALAPGDYAIQPLALVIDGQKTGAPSVQLTVREREATELAAADSIFGTLGTDEIWVGQTVVHHVEFRTRKRLLDMHWQAPNFEGFVPDPVAPAQQREYPLIENGINWTLLELDTPLQAVAAGAREVPGGVMRAQFAVTREVARRRGFGLGRITEARTEVFATDSLSIKVRPLPEEGRSPDWSGLVGQFEIQTRLDRSQVRVGQSATLTVVLSGTGGLASFQLPQIAEGQGFRAYDDEPEIRAEVRGGRYESVGTWRRAIVPESTGLFQVPPVVIQVFDPLEGTYVTLRSAPLRLQVLSGENTEISVIDAGSTGGDQRRKIARVGEDILPIHPNAQLRSQVFNPAHPMLLAVMGVPFLVLLGVVAREQFQRLRPRHDPAAALRRRAALVENRALGVGELEVLFREALGLALGLPAAGVERASAESGLTGPLKDSVLSLYRDLDRARYGGGDHQGLQARVLVAVAALLNLVQR